MNAPRFLLLGKNGQVGWELLRTLAPLGPITAVDYPEVDFTRPEALRRWMREAQPTVLVNAAAYTAVDQSETEPDSCMAINGTAPGVLAEEAARQGALLVHYSTDYVFDGTKSSPYLETDAPNPLGVYGRTKLAGDQAVRESGCDHLIFRLCWVYGARGKNFMLTMKRLAGERDTVRVVADQHGCPTWSRMIAEATAQALAKALSTPDRSRLCGTYHLAAGGQTTWHGFAKAIIESIPADRRRCRQIEAINTDEYPTPARRPAYSVLDCGKLERTFGLRLPDWQASLHQAQET